MNDYLMIGIKGDNEEELLDFAQACTPFTRFGTFEDQEFAVSNINENIELWYYGDEGGVYPTSLEMIHRARQQAEGSVEGWVRFPEENNTGLLQVMMDRGDTEFPLNVEILDAFLLKNTEWENPAEGKGCRLQLTLFPHDLDMYEDEESYRSAGNQMAAESCIPCGMFPLPGKEAGFKPSATAVIAGKVTHAQLMENPLTGLKYWWVSVRCLGNVFDFVAAPEVMPETVKAGNIAHGLFWIAGKILMD